MLNIMALVGTTVLLYLVFKSVVGIFHFLVFIASYGSWSQCGKAGDAISGLFRLNSEPVDQPVISGPFPVMFVIAVNQDELTCCFEFHKTFAWSLKKQSQFYWQTHNRHGSANSPEIIIQLVLEKNPAGKLIVVRFELWWFEPTAMGDFVIPNSRGEFECFLDLATASHQVMLAQLLAEAVCKVLPQAKPKWESVKVATR